MSDFDIKELLTFQVNKDFAYLYKRLLTELEDLQNQHAFMLQKLEKELPPQYHALIRAANFFDGTEFAFRRKKILDAGNDAKRNLLEQIAKFEISLPSNKD